MKYIARLKESEYYGSFSGYKGELTLDKVIARIKKATSSTTTSDLFTKIYRRAYIEISKFSSPEELMDNIYWHGTNAYISNGLRAGAFVKGDKGGGYEYDLHTISVTKSKKVASIFATVHRNDGSIYPVLLKQGAVIRSLPDISDSNEVEDNLIELFKQKVDAVKIGDWSKQFSEQELVVLNPHALLLFRPLYFNAITSEQEKELKEPPIEIYAKIFNAVKDNPPPKGDDFLAV